MDAIRSNEAPVRSELRKALFEELKLLDLSINDLQRVVNGEVPLFDWEDDGLVITTSADDHSDD